MRRWLFFGAMFVSALVGCGDDDDADDASTSMNDGGRDSGANAGMDSGVDAGIDAGSRDTGAGADAAGPDRFSAIYATIIMPTCAGSNCHDSSSPAGNLDLSSSNATFDNLFNKQADGPACGTTNLARVLPGSAAMSLLVQKLEGTQTCGGQMPMGRTPLSADQIAGIRRWIDQGAIWN